MNAFVRSGCPDFWDSFVNTNSALLFHRSIWASVLREGYGGTPLFCWLEKGGMPVAGLMGAIMDFKLVRVFYAAVPYGGFIGDDSMALELLRQIEPELRKWRVHKIQIAEPRHLPIIEDAGYLSGEIVRHQLDLTGYSPESLEMSYPSSVRRALRKSRKENIEIGEIRDRSEIDKIYELYVKTMARNRAAAKYPIGRFLAIYDLLVPKKMAVIMAAYCEGKLIGSNTLVCSGDTVHSMQPCHDHNYQHKRPNDALVHASLLWTMSQGRQWFDFMGSPAEDHSLQQFKSKWGAQRSTTCNYSKNLSPLRGKIWTAIQRFADQPFGAWLVRRLRQIKRGRED